MFAASIGWFLGTKVGRAIAISLAAIAFSVVLMWRIFTAGRRTERAAQDQQALRNFRTRQETHDAIATRPADKRRDDLRRWVRAD